MRQREKFSVFLRQAFWTALAVANYVQGFACGDERTRGVIENLIRKRDRAAARLRDMRADSEHIIKMRRMLVRAVRASDNNKTIVLDFHLLVAESHLPHQLHARDLKPYEKIRVIYHAHLVGLRIAHANCCFADRGHTSPRGSPK